ncbi:MAG TPA: methyltransferase domain-containing protein [Rhizomicrobium sp.]|nr:methyltransferase domain-containing protein [Rhizomicrobium sp.]
MSSLGESELSTHRAYYNEFWGNHAVAPDSAEVERLAEILLEFSYAMDHLAPHGQRPRICDFGCGRGWLSAEFARFGDVTGVDLSSEGVRLAAERWPHIRFVAADLTRWRPGETFDLVVSSEVIEHVEDQAAFVATLGQVVRPGGYVILTTPTARAKQAYFGLGWEPQPIEAWLSSAQLKGLFARDFRVLRHRTYFFDFAHTGIYRLSNSGKLKRAFKALGLRHLYEGLQRNFDLGVTQIILARRKG